MSATELVALFKVFGQLLAPGPLCEAVVVIPTLIAAAAVQGRETEGLRDRTAAAEIITVAHVPIGGRDADAADVWTGATVSEDGTRLVGEKVLVDWATAASSAFVTATWRGIPAIPSRPQASTRPSTRPLRPLTWRRLGGWRPCA